MIHKKGKSVNTLELGCTVLKYVLYFTHYDEETTDTWLLNLNPRDEEIAAKIAKQWTYCLKILCTSGIHTSQSRADKVYLAQRRMAS